MLELGKQVSRMTPTTVFSGGKRREVAVTITQWTVRFRLKGERTTHELPIDALYRMAAQATVREQKRQRAEERKAKRSA